MTPWPPETLQALALAVLLSGCAQSALTGGQMAGSSDLVFARHSQGERTAAGIQWTFWIRNNASTASTPAVLHLSVSFSNSRAPPHQQTQNISSLEAGEIQVIHMTTTYVGFGDYFGTAEIRVGARAVARDPLFYEQCSGVRTAMAARCL